MLEYFVQRFMHGYLKKRSVWFTFYYQHYFYFDASVVELVDTLSSGGSGSISV